MVDRMTFQHGRVQIVREAETVLTVVSTVPIPDMLMRRIGVEMDNYAAAAQEKARNGEICAFGRGVEGLTGESKRPSEGKYQEQKRKEEQNSVIEGQQTIELMYPCGRCER